MSLVLEKLVPLGLLIALLINVCGCGQPILESEDCTAARDQVKRLYSLHMFGGANPRGESLENLRKLLSTNLFKRLAGEKSDSEDYLTQSRVFPKAFRVGTCSETESGPEFDVLLFWRTEEINRERKIVVTALKENKWVVNSVRRSN